MPWSVPQCCSGCLRGAECSEGGEDGNEEEASATKKKEAQPASGLLPQEVSLLGGGASLLRRAPACGGGGVCRDAQGARRSASWLQRERLEHRGAQGVAEGVRLRSGPSWLELRSVRSGARRQDSRAPGAGEARRVPERGLPASGASSRAVPRAENLRRASSERAASGRLWETVHLQRRRRR